MRAFTRYGVVGIGDSADARAESYLFAAAPVWIAVSLPAFMMLLGDAHDLGGEIQSRQQQRSLNGMLLHVRALAWIERPGLFKHITRGRQFTDVMKERARKKIKLSVNGEAELKAERARH